MRFDWLLVACIAAAAGIVAVAVAVYLAAGDIWDRFFGEKERFP